MNVSTLIGLGVLAALAVGAWITAYTWHKAIQSTDPEAIRVPRPIGVFFGSLRPDKLLDYRGVLLQLGIYVGSPVFALMVLGVISQRTAITWLSWPLLALVVLALAFAVRRR